jgi:hypothetical protein
MPIHGVAFQILREELEETLSNDSALNYSRFDVEALKDFS